MPNRSSVLMGVLLKNKGGVKGGDQGDALILVPCASNFRQVDLTVEHEFGGRLPQADDDFGSDRVELSVE